MSVSDLYGGIPGVTWRRVPVTDADPRCNMMDISNGDVDLPEQFGDIPEDFLVHEGDVTVDGGLLVTGGENTLYVVDGDLTVNGTMLCSDIEQYTSLYVTGTVTVTNLRCSFDSQLFIGGSLIVRNILVTALEDAGHFITHGPVTVGAWIDDSSRGTIGVAAPPTGRLIAGADTFVFGVFGDSANPEALPDAVRAEFIDTNYSPVCLNHGAIEEAFSDGRPMLR